MKAISLASSKGGSGKTTTTLNLGMALAEKGRSTLIVDLDPQGAIGLSLARGDAEWTGLAEHLIGNLDLEAALFATKVPTLTLLPRGRLDPMNVPAYEDVLRHKEALPNILQTLPARFDYVLLDTPSGLGTITRAALAASDYILVPLQAEPLAMRSIGQILRVIAGVRESENPRLELLGILATMVQLNQNASFAVMCRLWTGFEGVLETFIPRAEVFTRASEEGLPLAFLSGRPAPEVGRYEMLASEIETIIAHLSGPSGEVHEQPRRELV